MDKFIPNLTIAKSDDLRMTLEEWARRLTSNNLILIDEIKALKAELAELNTRLENLEGNNGG